MEILHYIQTFLPDQSRLITLLMSLKPVLETTLSLLPRTNPPEATCNINKGLQSALGSILEVETYAIGHDYHKSLPAQYHNIH